MIDGIGKCVYMQCTAQHKLWCSRGSLVQLICLA